MADKSKRAAIYLRVSTDSQTTDNQRRDLEAAAAQRGWIVTEIYEDAGISGAKGRDKRPGLDRMLNDATRGKMDVVMCWAVDRMGRSLADLISTMETLKSAKVALFLWQQALDTTTAAGEALFGMLGVFSQFERKMIQARIVAGLERVKEAEADPVKQAKRRSDGKKRIGRPMLDAKKEQAIRDSLTGGTGVQKTARTLKVGTATVQRVKREMAE